MLAVLFCLVGGGAARGVDVRQRTVSTSGQFIVYCDDKELRSEAASFCEELKSGLLRTLGATDQWTMPVVLRLMDAQAASFSRGETRLTETPDGWQVGVDFWFGRLTAREGLDKLIIRAVLMEMIYRRPGSVRAGEPYRLPPWWLEDGVLLLRRQRDVGLDPAPFRALMQSQKLPSVEGVLCADPSRKISRTAAAMDALFGYALLKLLLEQPEGRAGLAGLLKGWPEEGLDPLAALHRYFPAFAASPLALQKLWALHIARLAAADPHNFMEASETETELQLLLRLEIPVGKYGSSKGFDLAQFAEFLPLEGARRVLQEKHAALLVLGTRAHPLFRPIIADYEQVFALLEAGRTGGMGERLVKISQYRREVLSRMDKMNDLLNFYEATQMKTRSSAFDGYLEVARRLSELEVSEEQRTVVNRMLDEWEEKMRKERGSSGGR